MSDEFEDLRDSYNSEISSFRGDLTGQVDSTSPTTGQVESTPPTTGQVESAPPTTDREDPSDLKDQ